MDAEAIPTRHEPSTLSPRKAERISTALQEYPATDERGGIGHQQRLYVARHAERLRPVPEVAGTALETGGSSDGNAGVLAGVAGAVAAGADALSGAAWWARRRWAK